MPLSWVDPNLFAVLFLGAAVPLAALGSFFVRVAWGGLLSAAAALTLGVGAAAAGLAGQPTALWLPPALLAGLCAASAFVRSRPAAWCALTLGSLARRPQVHAAAFFAAGPVLAAAWLWWTFPVIPVWDPPATMRLAHEVVPLLTDRTVRPHTDLGQPLTLYHPASPDPSPRELADMDAASIANLELQAGVIRTAAPDRGYNCHGWVFTEGRGWLQGAQVEAILRDNGYHAVAAPEAGDVAVYRGPDGAITHSGVVRVAGPGCPVLVESKWGQGGRFLHPPTNVPYAGEPTFYRSPRVGRLIRGLEPSSGPPPETAG